MLQIALLLSILMVINFFYIFSSQPKIITQFLKTQLKMNELPKMVASRKFIFQTQLNPNPNRLSLSQKLQSKSPKNKVKTLALPGIGQMFVMDLIKNQAQKQNKTKKSQATQLSIKEENKPLIHTVNQNNNFPDKQNKSNQNFGRLSVIQLCNINKRNSLLLKNIPKQQQEQELIDQSTNKNIKIKRKFSLKTAFSVEKETNKNISKVDAMVQTLNSGKCKQSYEEFIKFRLTQKQMFEKLKNLFGYIQNLTLLQQQNKNNNVEQYRSIFTDKLTDQRQKRVEDLMKDVQNSSKNFTSLFKNYFINEIKALRDQFKNQQHLNSLMKKNMKQLQEIILKLMIQKQIFSQVITPKDIKEAFQVAINKFDPILKQNQSFLNHKTNQCYNIQKQLQQSYTQWHRNVTEQSRLIKNCVFNIMQLPQISMGLFGFEQLTDHDKVNKDIKNYCFNQRKIPEISDFFMKKGHHGQKQINQVFRKCCEIKCMNCIYMRSKMKFIYDKNKELKPVLKVLMKLIQKDQRQAELQRRLSKKE